MSKAKLSPARFKDIEPVLRKRLTEGLEKELLDCALPELGQDTNTDLWTPPAVDSKTVVKLSPIVKELTGGWPLDPTWIRKGGYPTVADAVAHAMAEIKQHCVAEPVTTKSKEAVAVAS